MNNHSKSNRFLLGVAGICIGLSIASVKPHFKGQRIAIFTLGLISSQAVLSRCKNVQSLWEKSATAAWEEIQEAKQKLTDTEIELKEKHRQEQSAVQTERTTLTRERDLLRGEAESLERELLAHQDAANADLMRKEAEFERLKVEASATLERMQAEANESLNRKKQAMLTDVAAQASKEIEQVRVGYQKALEQAKSELEKAEKDAALWKHRYDQLDKPRLPRRRENMAERFCEDYIFALWRHEVKRDSQSVKVGNSSVKFAETIKTDCDDRQPIDVATHFAFWLKLRNPEHFQTLKTDAVREKLAIALKTPVPYFVIEGSEGVIRCEIPQKPGYVIPKEYRNTEREKNLKLYDITSLEAKRGFLITGHPGSGKTSVMRFLGQVLGGKDAQRLALTPHEEDAASFQDAGFAVITDVQQILQQLQLLDEEIKLRGKDSSRRFKLIVAIDELGRILTSGKKAELKPEDLMESIRQMAVEGRKLDVIVLVGNHSQTTSAIKMDSEFRNSFYQLFLCGAALHVDSQPGKDARLTKEQEEYLHEAAYPCLALINSQFKLCKHPTHHEYSEYKDSGNPPKNIEQWEVNSITIPLASGCQHLAKKEDRKTHFSLSEDEQVLLDWVKEKQGEFYPIKNAANRSYFAKQRQLKLTEITAIIVKLNSLGLVELDNATTPQRYRARV
jgi:hypothetical protein